MATLLPLRIFAEAEKRRHTALAVVIVMSCIALPVPSSTFFTNSQSASPAAHKQPVPIEPSANAETEDRSEPFAAVTVPATIQAFFVTDLYAKDSGYVSQVNNEPISRSQSGNSLQCRPISRCSR
jgi:hypothetical protein